MIDVNYTDILDLSQKYLKREERKGNRVLPSDFSIYVKKAFVALEVDEEGVDIKSIVDELIRMESEQIDQDIGMSDTKGHLDWLKNDRKKDWRYWARYKRFLQTKMSYKVVDALDRSTDSILAELEDPTRSGSWDRRGLVVGHVQSGKTTNYSALICKAADAGYKIIIVLAGLHNNLRAQTQIRLEEAFLGYKTSANGPTDERVGVYEFDKDVTLMPHCATNRSERGDFNATRLKGFYNSPEVRPWLFVVKKNKSVLEGLLKWIKSHHVSDYKDPDTGRSYVTKLPLLVIDDESDNASVDTGDQHIDENGIPDPEYNPKTINSLIRKILFAFSKSAYVGYTATPFANIFIHRGKETDDEGPDLFPEAFIRNLSAPTNYVGPDRIFGLNVEDGRQGGLPLIRVVSDYCNEDMTDGWIFPGHKKDHKPTYMGQHVLPLSLRKAVLSFLIGCSVRHLRGQGNQHCSMLIHVTRFTLVQKIVYEQVRDYLNDVRQRVVWSIESSEIKRQLQELWDNDFLPTTKELVQLGEEPVYSQYLSWNDVYETLKDVLHDLKDPILVNGSASDILDYEEHRETGLKVIAIGGDKLARGLTLEGLTVSYFVRTSKMYDTLMQMGRWFGYRPSYLDVCRLYTSQELVTWFQHVTDASRELREDFELMSASRAIPYEYGMRVESHSTLTVTSPLKMRSAKTLKISYSGAMVQTVSFSKESIDHNFSTLCSLVKALPEPDEKTKVSRIRPNRVPDNWFNSYLWKNISSTEVLNFLQDYVTPPGAGRVNSKLLYEFISRMNAVGELTKWSIALLGVESSEFQEEYRLTPIVSINGLFSRALRDETSCSIRVLTDPKDETIDVDDALWELALIRTEELERKKLSPGESLHEVPTRPSGKALREIKGKSDSSTGLLILYPIALTSAPLSDKGETRKDRKFCEMPPVAGFAISFPSSDSVVTVGYDYKVDHLYWEENYGG